MKGGKEMLKLFDKAKLITLKEGGMSNREVAREMNINRKTVNKYWNEYKNNLKKLSEVKDIKEKRKIQEEILKRPQYNTEGRMKRKLTPDFYDELNTSDSEVCYQEFSGFSVDDIKKLRSIIGKHVYNKEEEGKIRLIIEN